MPNRAASRFVEASGPVAVWPLPKTSYETTFDAFDHYWLRRGWAQQAPIKLMSRIDTPRALGNVTAGTVPIGGVIEVSEFDDVDDPAHIPAPSDTYHY